MIKFRSYLLILVLCVGMLVSGCAGSEEESQSAENSQSQISKKQAADNEILSDRQADLTGVVKSVIGNEIILAVVEMPEMSEGTRPTGEAPAANGEKMQPPADAGEGNPPQDRNNPPRERPQASDTQEGSRPQMELTYTGEEVTIIIPAGLEIVSQGRGIAAQESASSEDAELTQIVKGNVVSVCFQDGTSGENAVVEEVRILAQSAGAQ